MHLFKNLLCFTLVTLAAAPARSVDMTPELPTSTVSASYPADCTSRDARLCRVYAQLQRSTQGHKVQFMPPESGSNPKFAYEWVVGGADYIYEGLSNDYNDAELFYVIAHEFGHSIKRHGRIWLESVVPEAEKTLTDLAMLTKYGPSAVAKQTQTRDLNHRLEYEADEFAVERMLEAGLDPVAAMRGALTVNFSDIEHPSKRQRLAHAQRFIASLENQSALARKEPR